MPDPPPEVKNPESDATADSSPLARRLEDARLDLLELSTRNRLLHTPRHRKRSRALEIVGESSDAVYHRLVARGKTVSFVEAPDTPPPASDPAPETQAQTDGLPAVEPDSAGALFRQPEDETPPPEEEPPEQKPADEQAEAADDPAQEPEEDPPPHDGKLGTTLAPADLQKRLLRTFYDARSSQQEQGVNTLFLALGFLRWYEDERRDKPRDAPLLLVPVTLDRRSARTRFVLRWDEQEVATNLSLQAKLRAEFGVELPEVPEDYETLRPSEYFAQVREAVAGVPRWEVLSDNAVLSFFSFSRFLMYRDLDAEAWGRGDEALDDHPLLAKLLGNAGFDDAEPVLEEGQTLDDVVGPRDMVHVVPADTSQAVAVEAVRRGRNLVIQGPPGTGKSQTIANLVAAAVREGKKVLFVAEKMAALEVVKRRLANVGLGDMCLELHSHKARKRAVLDDLQHTMSLGDPKDRATDDYFERLTEARDTLNRHAAQLHTPIAATGVTPYGAIGHLVRLRAAGVAPADFTLDGPAGWDETKAAAARRALDALTKQVETLGTPADHAWRGAGVASILPMDLERLIDKLPDAAASLRSAEGKARELADLLEDDSRLTPGRVNALADRARRLAETPPLDPEAITHDVWAQQGPAVTELVEQGLGVDTIRQQLDGVVAEAAWSADLSQARLDLAAHGSSWLRFLNPNYRAAKRRLQAVLTGPLPKDHAERLQTLDRLIEARNARSAIERGDAVGRYAFGSMWRGVDSDFAALSRVHGWNRRNDQRGDAKTCRQLVARRSDLDDWKAELPGAADGAERAVASAGRAFDAAAAAVALDLGEAFGVEELIDLPLTATADRLEAWHASPDGLSRWIAYRDRRAAAREAGLGQLVDRLEAGDIDTAAAADAFGMAYHEALLRQAFDDRPDLARFDGEAHERTLAVFRELDGQRLALARHEVAEAHHAGLPRGGGEVGQVGLLRREFQKKRRHLPLRRLLREAGLAVQAVKPVFMMSPMSVAQYLEPGGLNFDLMLIDEASQVRPVDALGAVARCRQIVVVGDDKQLPPTRFFDAMTSAGEDGEDDDAAELDTSDLESILGLCTAQNVPTAMLRWHYRSLHPSLIAVSNREFYDGNLYVIPSPLRDAAAAGLGLRFHKITEGHFDRGGSATHRVEAAAIADAVMRHARETPELSLGVGAFSVGQRDAILDEVERRRREDHDADAFFGDDRDEPFFVKNLENIQGDERDVIFISVGYGPDADGHLSMNFGPLSNEGGERRLNVLITRAKRRLEVFSSMTAEDIDLSRVSRRGPAAFRTFLQFAERGGSLGGDAAGDDRLTVFTAEVKRALEAEGLEVETGVGEAGFRVDLAVVDPDDPGRYRLAIMLDGPGYAASGSARERDASREFILKLRGWRVLRLWEVDWFNRPLEQTRRVIDAVRLGTEAHTPAAGPRRSAPTIERDATEPAGEAERFAGISIMPYAEARFKKIPRKDVDELDVFQRMELVTKVVAAEGPVHRDEVVRRSADIYRVERLTAKLSELLASAVEDAVNARKLVAEDAFLSLPGFPGVEAVRSRADVESAGLRKPEMLPPAEVRFALTKVAEVAIGVSRDDAVIEASRLLGFASTREALREVLERQIAALVADGVLEDRDGCLFVAEGV
ncbi:MAG: DUF4011 domain-containing protein [Planctomycetota bacterium]